MTRACRDTPPPSPFPYIYMSVGILACQIVAIGEVVSLPVVVLASFMASGNAGQRGTVYTLRSLPLTCLITKYCLRLYITYRVVCAMCTVNAGKMESSLWVGDNLDGQNLDEC